MHYTCRNGHLHYTCRNGHHYTRPVWGGENKFPCPWPRCPDGLDAVEFLTIDLPRAHFGMPDITEAKYAPLPALKHRWVRHFEPDWTCDGGRRFMWVAANGR